jgi:hypothetical protein
MTAVRAAAIGALVASLTLAAALGAYAVGRGERTTNAHARAVRLAVERVAGERARTRGFITGRAQGRTRGVSAGRADGHAAGVLAGKRKARRELAQSQPQPQALVRVVHTCPSGEYTTASGACAPNPPGYGTPPANSPEGRAIIQSDPTCQEPPPPPGYNGPIQCNNP